MSFTPPEPTPSDPSARQPFSAPAPAPAPTPQPAPQYGEYATQPPAYPAAYPTPPQVQQYYAEGGRPKGTNTLGLIAFVAGIFVLVVSPIVSGIIGGSLGGYVTPGETFSQGFAQGSSDASANPAIALGGLAMVIQVILGTLIGVWAIVQGIIAIRLNRGRVFGILAIVFGAVAPVLSFIVFSVASGVASAAAH